MNYSRHLNKVPFHYGYQRISAVRLDILFRRKKIHEKQGNVQVELLIGHGKQGKKRLAEASDGEIKKLVDNYLPRNTNKSTKYAGTTYARLPWEIIRRVIK